MLRFSNGFFVNWLRTFQTANSFMEYKYYFDIWKKEKKKKKERKKQNKSNTIYIVSHHFARTKINFVSFEMKAFSVVQASKFSNNKAYVDIILFVVDFVIVFIVSLRCLKYCHFKWAVFRLKSVRSHTFVSPFFPLASVQKMSTISCLLFCTMANILNITNTNHSIGLILLILFPFLFSFQVSADYSKMYMVTDLKRFQANTYEWVNVRIVHSFELTLSRIKTNVAT